MANKSLGSIGALHNGLQEFAANYCTRYAFPDADKSQAFPDTNLLLAT
jgi:hypothetical protein